MRYAKEIEGIIVMRNALNEGRRKIMPFSFSSRITEFWKFIHASRRPLLMLGAWNLISSQSRTPNLTPLNIFHRIKPS
jgi:hypothetical protein